MILKDLISFLASPKIINSKPKFFSLEFFISIWQLLSLSLIVSILLAWINFIVLQQIGFDINGSNIISKQVDNLGLVTVILSLVVVAPIMEEITFRGWLSPNKNWITISMAFFGFYSYTLFLRIGSIPNNSSMATLVFAGIIGIYILLAISFNLLLSPVRVNQIVTNNSRLLTYLSILTFAGFHIFNYQQFPSFWPLIVLLILPQIIGASILSFIRVRWGMLTSILSHSLINGILSLQFFITLDRPTPINFLAVIIYLLAANTVLFMLYQLLKSFKKVKVKQIPL